MTLARLVVTGSECTGKTTLARALAEHLRSDWVAEQSRAYARSIGRPLTADDVTPIAVAQIRAEDAAQSAAERRGDDVLVLDTDLVSTVVYANHYYGSCPAWIASEARQRQGALYLLCDIDIPWIADAVRDRPEAREILHQAFVDTLAGFLAPTCPVSGLGPARLEAAVACLERARIPLPPA